MNAKIDQIRGFNRFYTKILGLLNHQVYESPYSLTEVRVLYEIGHTVNCSAKTLIELLDLDKSYLSRILKRFENQGFITRKKDENDNRLSYLYLTEAGQSVLKSLNDASNCQIERLIHDLPDGKQDALVRNMQTIERMLTKQPVDDHVVIREVRPGDLGFIIHRHGVLYAEEYGLDGEFENYVLQGIARFLENRGPRDRFWIAEWAGSIVGSIAIVETGPKTAQLRWFLIEPETRNQGIGKKLLNHASDYWRLHFNHIFLWTVQMLEPARHLYQKYGFRQTETGNHRIWGRELTEERWDLHL